MKRPRQGPQQKEWVPVEPLLLFSVDNDERRVKNDASSAVNHDVVVEVGIS